MKGLRLTEERLAQIQKRLGVARTHTLESSPQSKYRNKRVWANEWGWFDSQKELDRWRELLLLEKAGKITGLERQIKFILAPATMVNGRQIPPLRYLADFRYIEEGRQIVEDCKSEPTKTRAYKIKRHLMATVHGIPIRET